MPFSQKTTRFSSFAVDVRRDSFLEAALFSLPAMPTEGVTILLRILFSSVSRSCRARATSSSSRPSSRRLRRARFFSRRLPRSLHTSPRK
ncbi:unnamed protein product, partial [Nesidiocoris tenuis]